jgi:CSLREA domain-containing protein
MVTHSGRLALAVAICAFMSADASAFNFVVDKTADDAGGGACVTATPNDCSLRSAIKDANALMGDDSIALSATTYHVATDQEQIKTDGLTITGAGTRSTIVDGGGLANTMFDVGVASAVTITDLTVRAAAPAANSGLAAVQVSNASPLRLTHVAIVDNASLGLDVNGGTVDLNSSLVARNSAPGVGGVANASGAILTIKDSTIAQNTGLAAQPGQPLAYTGGLVGAAVTTVVDSTIAGNRTEPGVDALGGDNVLNISVSGQPALMRLRNTIVADPGPDGNCGGPIESGGHNLDSDGTCHFGAISDLVGVDPLLLALADNGGPTDTRALPADSPAVDAGGGCAAADQRGVPRPAGGACDIGAFESPFTAPGRDADGCTRRHDRADPHRRRHRQDRQAQDVQQGPEGDHRRQRADRRRSDAVRHPAQGRHRQGAERRARDGVAGAGPRHPNCDAQAIAEGHGQAQREDAPGRRRVRRRRQPQRQDRHLHREVSSRTSSAACGSRSYERSGVRGRASARVNAARSSCGLRATSAMSSRAKARLFTRTCPAPQP